MKKLFVFLSVTALITACGNGTDKQSTSAADSTAVTQPATVVKDSSAAVTPAVKDSLMQFKAGKVMISLGGSWSPLTGTVTTTNGRKVNPNGEVSKNGKTKKLEEGMMIDKDGQLMDKDGKPMDTTGWE
jgi:hypothetical protein